MIDTTKIIRCCCLTPPNKGSRGSTPGARTVRESAITTPATISLDELSAQSALQDRVDRKYLIEAPEVPRLLLGLGDNFRVLEIDGFTWFAYCSTYYDTPDLDCYSEAGTGRRRRFKVRTREYLATDQHFLEAKTRGPRKMTVKDRPARTEQADLISPDERRWLSEVLTFRGIPNPPVDQLPAALTTNYSHRTLQICPPGQPISRMTIDLGLKYSIPADGFENEIALNDYAIVETKGSPRRSYVDHLRWTMRHRPTSISKFDRSGGDCNRKRAELRDLPSAKMQCTCLG